MVTEFVLDCSVAMTWFLPDEATSSTRTLFDNMSGAKVWVPSLWRTEMANAMRSASRSGRISLQNALTSLEMLEQLNIQVADDELGQKSAQDILKFAHSHDISSYDAGYLYVAMQMQLPLATLDKNLRRAAKAAKIALL
jgi:predicted nucleic acid-binding protein